MSNSSDFEVGYVANLARLNLTEEESQRFQGQLDGILSCIETLQTIDVDGIEPTAHPAPLLDRMREDDCPPSSIDREAFLQNAPDQAMDQLRVPKVVDPS